MFLDERKQSVNERVEFVNRIRIDRSNIIAYLIFDVTCGIFFIQNDSISNQILNQFIR